MFTEPGAAPQPTTAAPAAPPAGYIRKGEHSTLAVRYKPIEGEEQTDSGHIDSWLGLLKADKRAIFRASGHARSASEYALNLEQQLQQAILDDSLCMNGGTWSLSHSCKHVTGPQLRHFNKKDVYGRLFL
jgi:hypothetical protein